MVFSRLTDARCPRFARAFSLYERSFPLHEQRLLRDQQAVLRHPEYHFFTIEEGGRFCGLLLCWETGNFVYVEHFAICEDLRGTGLGSRALHLLLQTPRTVILEIDPPEDEVSRRRKGFYLRAGFCENPYPHAHPPYRHGFEPHRLVLLSAPGPVTPAQYAGFNEYLRGTVMAFAER